MMMRPAHTTPCRVLTVLGMGLLAACTNWSQVQAPATKLGTAITAAVAAQQTIYSNANTGAQNVQIAFFHARWLTEKLDKTALLAGPTTAAPAVPAAELAVRQTVLKGVGAYGQAMTAIASGTEDTTLSTSATSIGQSLKTIATDKGAIGTFVNKDLDLAALNTKLKSFGMSSTDNAGDLAATAINSIGQVLIDYAKAHELQQSAKSMQPHLASLAAIFEAENANLVRGVTAEWNSEIDAVRVKMELAVLNDRNATKGQLYGDMQKIEADSASLKVPADDAPAASAWDAVVKANADVAGAKPDLAADAQDALDRAQAAVTFYKGLQK